MTDLLVNISAEELEKMFDGKPPCDYRADGRGLVGTKDTVARCHLPATWAWLFEKTCDHGKLHQYLCATHHVLLSEAYESEDAWLCMHCAAPAYVKEKRRI